MLGGEDENELVLVAWGLPRTRGLEALVGVVVRGREVTGGVVERAGVGLDFGGGFGSSSSSSSPKSSIIKY